MRVIAALAVVLLLTGCSAASPEAAPSTPSPSATPVFASEEEALAAAEEAYAAYVAVSNQVFSEGGINPERLNSVATGDFLADEMAGFERILANGWRSTGLTAFRDVVLQRYSPGSSTDIVGVYVCEDVSGVDVLDSSGASVVSPSRPETTVMQVTFDLGDENALLVSSREAWRVEPC